MSQASWPHRDRVACLQKPAEQLGVAYQRHLPAQRRVVAMQVSEVLHVFVSAPGGGPILVGDRPDVVIQRLVEEPWRYHVSEVVPVQSRIVGHRLAELLGKPISEG